MPFPLLTVGHVIAHAPDGHGVQVLLKTGESPLLPVLVGTHGPNDGLRVNHTELPSRGTWGLMAFPHGDARNGIWICSYNTNALDAFTAGPADTAMRYKAHHSGHWEMVDQSGNTAEVWPDGSSMVVGNNGTVPATYRHTLDKNGARQRVPFTQAQRVTTAPAAMPRVFTHASGATVTISTAGVVSEMSATGQVINVGAIGDTLYRLIDERVITLFNNHVHTNGNGGANTGTSTTQLNVASCATTHLHAG